MSRELFEEVLRENGAIIQSAVTSKTDLVIALDKPSAKKLAKAEQLGIPIIFLQFVKNKKQCSE